MIRSIKKSLILKFLCAFTAVFLFAAESDKPEIQPMMRFPDGEVEAKPEIQKETEEKTVIIIKSNVAGAEVYLNGIYYGQTNLEIEDLNPGFYHLELRKRGYEKEHFYIRVRKGYSVTYFFKMRKIFGLISLQDLPSESQVYLNNSLFTDFTSGRHFLDSKVAKVNPGYYEVRIRKFGFDDFVTHIDVLPYETVRVYVEMHEADFVLDDFTVSKQRFNPAYKNHLGQTEFSFYVTKPGEVEAVIQNEEGEEIVSYHWNHFTTWNNSFFWDGKSRNGIVLPDGKYTAIISAEDYSYRLTVLLDSSISYPVMMPTKVGGGIGNLPALFSENTNFCMPYLQLSPAAVVSPLAGFSSLEVNAGFLWNFLQHCEFSVNASVFPAGSADNGIIHAGGAVKLYSKVQFDNQTALCYGAILRYGYSDAEPFEKVIDTGNGLGGGFLLGLSTLWCDFGFSSQFMFGARDGLLDKDDELLVNGITMEFKISDSVRLNGWCGLNSYGKLFSKPDCPDFNWLNGLDGGVEMLFMPEGTSIILGLKLGTKIFFNDKVYLTGNLGAAFLF